jgi:preprotein translocase subunit YajC
MSFLIIIILFAVAWVVLILPKQRELKRHNAFVQSLAVGDEVMTGSGIYGTLVEVAPGVEIKIARRAIASQVVDPSVTETDDSGKTNDEDSDA